MDISTHASDVIDAETLKVTGPLLLRNEEGARYEIPYGNSPSAMIHVADIADVGVAALIGDGHAGKIYTLTGQEVLTVFDKVRIIGATIGMHIQSNNERLS
ncbi:hypothetical protein T458_21145 [Brevibacillus panacihumi W25]|uniref:Uncharacterized protein n=1 Tax=Brevibacillus panacihumi W25 TaxID=1408254 RepID=V6M6J0_9BACL|nr:hypothetical protein [Brevibacillus panacihumi]EST53917.1 hypothetical protein T458_21145 [Brevibacillus panacihumi W25]